MALVLFAGNPNSGKTSLFNAITGFHYKVANYPGVTVEKKETRFNLPKGTNACLTDLPGIYDLHGSALDEQLAAQSILEAVQRKRPTLIVVVIDATQIERNLYLLSQLLDLGVPIIIAANMIDVLDAQGIQFYPELLSRVLSVPVIPVSAKKKKGIQDLLEQIEKNLIQPSIPKPYSWISQKEEGDTFKKCIEVLSEKVAGDIPPIQLLGLVSGAIDTQDPALREIVQQSQEALKSSQIDPESFEAASRYAWISTIIKRSAVSSDNPTHEWTKKIDSIITHRVWGFVIFLLLMASIFQSIFTFASIPMGWIDSAVSFIGAWVQSAMPPGPLASLLVDGVIAGVGSVLVFIPQIAILFIFLGLLEDSGYLARAAYLMDRVMRPLGLQGRSFIPLLNAFACAIPAILSTRTIASRSDRLTTILIAPLMSCSARLPVYTVLIAACIPPKLLWGFISLQGLVLFSMYILGILGAVLVSLILKHTLLKRQVAHFVMEMPPYRRPSIKTTIRQAWDRVKAFIFSAGTVILACSVILWALSSYPTPPEGYAGSVLEYSFAGRIGKFIEPAILPLGFTWEFGIAILASFAAREVFVSALSTVFNLASTTDSPESLIHILSDKISQGTFSVAAGVSLMVFFVFACQCMSTIAIVYRETRSKSWTIFMVAYMTVLAYVTSYIAFRLMSAWL